MTGLSKPSDVVAPVRDAGGDNEVPREKGGRPRIIIECPKCEGTGKVPSEKVAGRMNKCGGGCGPKKGDDATATLKPGQKLKGYTRTTTFIDVIEDKSNLEAWQMRMVLVGASIDRGLLNEVPDLHEKFKALEAEVIRLHGDHREAAELRRGEIEVEAKSIKDELNRRAQIAKALSGSEDKADKGTHLHGLSELTDQGIELPHGISFGDVIDMDAYRRATTIMRIVHMEKLVVHDEFQIGGTPDRVSELNVEAFQALFPEMWEEHGGLVAPDGSIILPGDLLITDLKTGTVEYGGLKMAMQLSIYSRSKLYDHLTGERTSLGPIRQDWGLIMHLPAGKGECTLYWADLNLGWEAVEVARSVRSLRSRSKSALKVLVHEAAA